MKLNIKNIGMIKEADVKLDGLTVIAGENDTGKSTLGKILFATVKADNIKRRSKKTPKEVMATWLNLVFDGNISTDGTMTLSNNKNKEILNLHIKDKNFIKDLNSKELDNGVRPFFDATFVQSPIVHLS